MRLSGVKINNYKSIGENQNYLLVEPKVTVLIGKNESGKSNVLESIGNISLQKAMNGAYLKNKNRALSGEISIIFELEFSRKEIQKYEIFQSKTRIRFSDTSDIIFDGGFSDLIEKDSSLTSAIEDVSKHKNNKNIWGNDSARLKNVADYINSLKNITTHIFINHKTKLNSLKNWIDKSSIEKSDLELKLNIIENRLDETYSILPEIYLRQEDRQLESSYKYDDIKTILNDENHIFYKFLLAAKISDEEILQAFDEKVDGARRTIKNTIEKKIKRNIEKRFNEFYKQEDIEFQIEIENRFFKIYILTDDKAMNLSERSNGLRWYISLFIDILSNEYLDKSVIFLLDEPGVFLHVNAQKKLLELFNDLASRENQVIYTTHSPYMIDSSDVLNIRAIEKDESGNTKIYKNAYNQDLSVESKMETLSPLVNAIGADLKFNLGPSNRHNIITEGISDYMYVQAMLNFLEVDNPPSIIPSAGVSNINKIVSILIGWGCDFKVVLDYDNAGYREYTYLINNLDDTLQDKIVFINCPSIIDQADIKSNGKTIEDLISNNDFKKLKTPYDGTNSTKVLAAKEYYDKVKNKELDPDEKTVSNFLLLFSHLGIYHKQDVSM